ncbi:MAG TPA: CoA-binding protein [Chitinophagaceae bacterium]|jgi:hypothetical protein
MNKSKKTLVLGASPNPARYSRLAVERLVAHNHPVIAIGKRTGNIDDVRIDTGKLMHAGVDTITLYLNPGNQKEYYEYIFSLKPERIIFNPGTENKELAQMAADKGIQTIEACTLVMLSTGMY